MTTDNLKKLKKFKEIHEYLLFKTTNGPAEITTILRRYDKSYEWEFTVPNVKVDFATRVLGEEIEKILNNEYLFHTSLPTDTSENYACFTFVLNDADLADIWCNNSVAAVYEVLGKFLATEILDNHELLEQAIQRFYQNGIPRSADESEEMIKRKRENNGRIKKT